MPQLDKMNWFLILTLLVLCLSIFLVIFIKRNFYSWRKVLLLKFLTKFNNSNLENSKILILLLSIISIFLNTRKQFFTLVNLNKTTLFSDTLKLFNTKIVK